MAGEGSVVQQYLVAKLAEVEAKLELLDAQAVTSEEREQLVALSARLLAALSFYEPTQDAPRIRDLETFG